MQYRPGPHSAAHCQGQIAHWSRRLAALRAAGYRQHPSYGHPDLNRDDEEWEARTRPEYDAFRAWVGVMGASLALRQQRKTLCECMVAVWQAELAVAVARESPEEVARAQG